jgi:YD repeat-containing protein
MGNVVTITDPLGHATLYRYDNRDRRLQITDALGQITRMSYDKVGNLLSLSDPVNNRTTYRYDGLNRKTAETNALGLSRTFQYDKVGNLIQTTDRNNRVTTFIYDQLNRQTQEQWLSSSGTAVNTISYTYDAASRLLSASDNDSRSTFTYDAVNRLVSTDNFWTKNIWGQTCVRFTNQNIDPPPELYPPRQRPATFIHYDTYWDWSGYAGDIATFTHEITKQYLDLRVGETSQGITLLKRDIAKDEVQVKLGNKLKVFKRDEPCDAAIQK